MTARRLGAAQTEDVVSVGDVALITGAFGPALFTVDSVETDQAGAAVAFYLKPFGSYDPPQRVDRARVSAILPNLLASRSSQ